jgi:hypothetical protein
VYVVTNGTTWGEYLADYANFSLNNFAISGATCDNRSTPRTYPDVTHNELGAYFNLTVNGTTPLPPDETLYTLWIGTNDVGVGELLTGQATSGVSIVNVSQCAVDWIQTLYDSGARNFLFQNARKMMLRSADITHHFYRCCRWTKYHCTKLTRILISTGLQKETRQSGTSYVLKHFFDRFVILTSCVSS